MVARSQNPKFSPSPVAQAIRNQYPPVGPGRLDNAENEAIAKFAGVSAPEDRYGARLKELLDAGRHHEAGEIIEKALEDNPGNFDAAYFLARLMVDTGKASIAHLLAEYLTIKHPDNPLSWFVLGVCETHVRRPELAVKALQKSIDMRPSGMAYGILSNACVMLHDFEAAKEAANKSLAYGDSHMPHVSLAFYHLHKRNWKEGWRHYKYQLGRDKDRAINDYGLPEWEGKGSVLIYGEQGLGDQLCYTSAIDGRCKQLVCHPKLHNLFKRSLDIEVYGDQFVNQIDWTPTAAHQSSMASAMQYQEVRKRGRWLTPHPDKKTQWQALMYSRAKVKDRPWVGLAWTGGRMAREQRARNVMPDQLKPILDLPLNFVSLEYREHENIPNVHQWTWATQTDDLDDFAALVDCLDVVISVPTTTYHLAGSLGVPCHVLVHDKPHFHEGIEGDCPWWESVKFYRGDRDENIAKIAEQLWRM